MYSMGYSSGVYDSDLNYSHCIAMRAVDSAEHEAQIKGLKKIHDDLYEDYLNKFKDDYPGDPIKTSLEMDDNPLINLIVPSDGINFILPGYLGDE